MYSQHDNLGVGALVVVPHRVAGSYYTVVAADTQAGMLGPDEIALVAVAYVAVQGDDAVADVGAVHVVVYVALFAPVQRGIRLCLRF